MSKAKEAAVEQTDIDWGSVEGGNSDFAIQYPRMQWQHGEAKASGFMKSGGLFISKEEYPNFTGEGFEPTNLITDDGTEIEGYAAQSAKLAVVRVKHQWVKDDKYNRNVPLVHALCYVKGCDEPINLSLRGATKALDFQKAFNQHISQNISLANRSRPQNSNALEPFALWFSVSASAPIKVTGKDASKSSVVTPPVLTTPEMLDRDYVVTLWVGTENYRSFAAFWRDTVTWQNTPIWKDREADVHNSDAPAFTGGNDSDPIAPPLLKQLLDLCSIKEQNEKEIMLGISGGEYTHFDQLNNEDARALIEELKKK